jgi:oligoendopeptidase F
MKFFFPNALTENDGGSHAVPRRSQIADEYKWQLGDLYESDAAFHAARERFTAEVKKLADFKGRLCEGAKTLAACLKLQDELSITISRLFAYARMNLDSDTTNGNYQAIASQMQGLLAEFSEASAFIEPEMLAIDETLLYEYLATEPELSDYTYHIKSLLRLKGHVLSPKEEALLAGMAEIRQAPSTIYSMLTNADMKFPFTQGEDGAMIELSEGRYNSLIRSRQPNVRKNAFENLFSTYAKFRTTFAATYAAAIKSAAFTARAKKFSSSINAALEVHNIPVSVYDNLIATTHANLAPLHKYIALKKKSLALDEIHMYDLYVPLSEKSPQEYDYKDGLRLVFDGLQPLGKKYLSDLKKGTDSGWIDVYENQGKRSGAYSWGVFGVHPFVLLNYDKKYGSVSTIAHELGHAMHSYYSSHQQPYINSDYTIFCAEVASTTNEILLLNHVLKNEADEKIRLFFINQHLEQVRTTVYRQVLFAEFEKIAHGRIESGEPLTADALDALWLDLNRKYYGNDIVIDDLIKIEWARIPHFYRPFYVYQYATGYAAATALAEALLNEGEPAQKRYLAYLAGGGSKDSLDLLKAAGVDMTSPEPIEITLRLFEKRLVELAELLEK